MSNKRKALFWHLYPAYLGVTLLGLVIIMVFACTTFRASYYKQVEVDLRARAQLIALKVQDLLQAKSYRRIEGVVKVIGEQTGMNVTIFSPQGEILATTWPRQQGQTLVGQARPAQLWATLDPEVQEAIQQKKITQSVRYDSLKQEDFVFLAYPMLLSPGLAESLQSIVRISLPLTSVQRDLEMIYMQILAGGLLLAFFITLLNFWFVRRIRGPIYSIISQAGQLAIDDESFRQIELSPDDLLEVENLVVAINRLSEQLHRRHETILEQKMEQEAVFASMIEGVVAVALDEKILHLNHAAAKLLGTTGEAALGLNIREVFKVSNLQNFIFKALKGTTPLEEELSIHAEDSDEEECIYRLHATALSNSQGKQIGAVLVMNDVTRLRRLEQHRKDFVANVSHELKTPLTNIIGFVETLLDEDTKDPEERERFLKITHRHAKRLNAIIEDLLMLSRIEKEAEDHDSILEYKEIRPVLEAAAQICEMKAKEKNIAIDLFCPEGHKAKINPPLLEQAIVNLIDNAIKYSDNGKAVQVKCRVQNYQTFISVQDQGQGIAPEHLPRIFERFYRVDKARSRQIGGTGLGLSIVKHVALAHRGKAQVESRLHHGSTFSLQIPH